MSTLKLENIVVEASGKVVVQDVSIHMKAGEVHVLMGANGSGKSSLVNAVMGHPRYRVSKGKILVDDKDITDVSPDKKAREGLFLSLQHVPEIEGVSLVKFLHRSYQSIHNTEISILEFQSLLKETAASSGLGERLIQRSVNVGLSGGERKQSEMLQMAMLRPKFAFLDEVDSGVDIDSLKNIFKAIEILRSQETGFLLITHYNNILSHITPDKIHIMQEGKLVRSGGVELVHDINERGFQEFI